MYLGHVYICILIIQQFIAHYLYCVHYVYVKAKENFPQSWNNSPKARLLALRIKKKKKKEKSNFILCSTTILLLGGLIIIEELVLYSQDTESYLGHIELKSI